MAGQQTSKTSSGRTIRDCIHGDIRLTALECAIVDTRPFQRLRYIRQNGLLHFVFPGAVHTRFAHSIGTLYVAGRVERQLLAGLRAAARKNSQRDALDYLAAVFRVAALLHDIGHCAFSHSIEEVKFKREPLLGRLGSFCEIWDAAGLLEQLEEAEGAEPAGDGGSAAPRETDVQHGGPQDSDGAATPAVRSEDDTVGAASEPNGPGEAQAGAGEVDEGRRLRKTPVLHEHISLVLVGAVFEDGRVREQCERPGEFAQDVRALIHGKLPPSARWGEEVAEIEQLVARLHGDCTSNLSRNLVNILHRLVSGTLDVDRLDYLMRDSVHCGVPYGRCDTNILVGNLLLGGVAGRLDLLLHRKAAHALADMLWSRYQLFVQVYNHKTNCAFNAALGPALSQALEQKHFDPPDTREALLYFTDDYVMGSLARACAHGVRDETKFARLLIHRSPPKQLADKVLLPGEDPDEALAELADEHEVDVGDDEILPHKAKTRFVKPDGLPTLVHNDRRTGRRVLTNFDEVSTVTSDEKFQATDYLVVHLFRDTASAK